MSTLVVGLISSIICYFFFPDFAVKTPLTEMWWSVFVVLAAAKVLFNSAGTAMVQCTRIHKEFFADSALPLLFRQHFKGAVVHTVMSIPLIMVSLKLWIWLPALLDVLAVFCSTAIFAVARKWVSNKIVPETIPPEKQQRYKDFVTLSSLATYAWRPALVFGILAIWGAVVI